MGELVPLLVKTAAAWEERGALARFRRALRRRDQLVLDALLQSDPAQPGISCVCDLPVETALLHMLLEEQKELHAIQEGLRTLRVLNIGDG